MNLYFCLLFVSFLLPAPAQDDAAKDAKALAGTWKMVKGEDKGTEFPAELVKDFQLKVEGDKFTFTMVGQQMPATFKVNPAKNPKELDITWTEGPDKDKTVKCVYELKEDTFTFRAGNKRGEGERPKSLTEGGEVLFVFKKDK
jgi:uncharacterized protein (TIGR03067 family)